jgi:hypothetical protein
LTSCIARRSPRTAGWKASSSVEASRGVSLLQYLPVSSAKTVTA